jgi:hypothetical protein
MEFLPEFGERSLRVLTALAPPYDSPSSQVHRISPTAARLSDQSQFGSLSEVGEKTSLSD